MIKNFVAALGLLALLAACENGGDSPQPKPRKDISLTRAEQELMDKGTDFAFRFFNQVCSTEEKPNVFVSPLSASFCLSMITNGAAGNTLAEMLGVLGFPAESFSTDDLNSYNRKLMTSLPDLDNTVRLGIANSIWTRQGFKINNAFADVNRQMYDARVQELDFNSPTAKNTINQWCADETNNLIKEVIKEIPDGMMMYLINALYFKGIWTSQFEKGATRQEDFTDMEGVRQKVDMMNQTASFNYTHNELFSIAELPYGNEAFSMVVLLPAEGKTLDESLSGLTAENWKQWSEDMSGAELQVKLPRFKVEYDKKLEKDMIAMGMKDVFDAQRADFSGMSDIGLFISLLEQFTYIDVNEEGTEAAAVTVGGGVVTDVGPGPAPLPFYVDRPFAFLIKEKSTGAILFMGKITKL